MTEVLQSLRALMAGAPGGVDFLLPACTAHAFGAEAFGPAMIAELFARHPEPLSPSPHIVQSPGGLALFDTDLEGREQAVIADLHDGRVGRLWRVGEIDPETLPDPAAEPALSLAYDPFLSQRRAQTAMLASDHPDLDPAALSALAEVARGLTEAQVGGSAIAIVARAFGAEGVAGALFAVHGSAGAAVREPRSTLAAVFFRYGPDGALLHRRAVIDAAPPPPRLARLVPVAA